MKRRDFFSLLAAISSLNLASRAAEAATPLLDLPFLMPLADDPNIVALCLAMKKITHAFCYILADGRTIYGEHGRCNDGTGWRECLPGEWEGRIVGRVVTMLIRQGNSWTEMGSSVLAG